MPPGYEIRAWSGQPSSYLCQIKSAASRSLCINGIRDGADGQTLVAHHFPMIAQPGQGLTACHHGKIVRQYISYPYQYYIPGFG